MQQPNDPFWFFPNDVIFNIALKEPIEGIPNLCLSSDRLNNLICNNNNFWKKRFILDFGIPEKNIILWKDAYYNYNTVFSFGNNNSGQLGLGDSFGRLIPTSIQPPNSYQEYGFEGKAKSIACGNYHSMFIDLRNNVWTCGFNSSGQLGLDDNTDRFSPERIMPSGEFTGKAKVIACGYEHSMLIDFNDNVWVFGSNENCQLGLGDTDDRHIPEQIIFDDTNKIKAVSCGYAHTVIID